MRDTQAIGGDACSLRIRFRCHRADRGARFVIVEADAFSALLRDDVKNVLGDRRVLHAIEVPLNATLINRGVRALGLARAAIDAFRSNNRCHRYTFPLSNGFSRGIYRFATTVSTARENE